LRFRPLITVCTDFSCLWPMCSYLFLFRLFWFYFAYCLLFMKWKLTFQHYIPVIFHTIILNFSCVWLFLFFEFFYSYLNLISRLFLFSSCPVPFYIMLVTYYKAQKRKICYIDILSRHICRVRSWFDFKLCNTTELLSCILYIHT
jgi:hypothetical protein